VKTNILVTLTLIASAIGSSYAAETATLKVKGTLTNAACTPTLSNGGTIDYGTLHLGELSATNVNQLGARDIRLTINCDSSTKVAFTSTDDRQDSDAHVEVASPYDPSSMVPVDDDSTFGLGKTAGGVSIGSYVVVADIDSASADGSAAPIIYKPTDKLNDDGVAWTHLTSLYSLPLQDKNEGNMTVGDQSFVPIAFKTATFYLKVSAAIQPTETLAITDVTDLDGQATISLVYL